MDKDHEHEAPLIGREMTESELAAYTAGAQQSIGTLTHVLDHGIDRDLAQHLCEPEALASGECEHPPCRLIYALAFLRHQSLLAARDIATREWRDEHPELAAQLDSIEPPDARE